MVTQDMYLGKWFIVEPLNKQFTSALSNVISPRFGSDKLHPLKVINDTNLNVNLSLRSNFKIVWTSLCHYQNSHFIEVNVIILKRCKIPRSNINLIWNSYWIEKCETRVILHKASFTIPEYLLMLKLLSVPGRPIKISSIWIEGKERSNTMITIWHMHTKLIHLTYDCIARYLSHLLTP